MYWSWGTIWACKRRLSCRPRMYRRIIKPYHAELIAAVKNKTNAKIFFHSDGNIYSLIGDLVDVGVDILNPVQVSAGDMGDTARLKREFGDRLSFCGAIDTQWTLPYGTPEDVRREVRRRIRGSGGRRRLRTGPGPLHPA